jgi:hypothetical protein
MNFFCTKKHLEKWLDEAHIKRDDMHALNMESAVLVAGTIFSKEP